MCQNAINELIHFLMGEKEGGGGNIKFKDSKIERLISGYLIINQVTMRYEIQISLVRG